MPARDSSGKPEVQWAGAQPDLERPETSGSPVVLPMSIGMAPGCLKKVMIK